MAKKTYNEKLVTDTDLPRVEFVQGDGTMAKRFGTGNMLIAAPMEYNELMKQVPRGKLVTTTQLRETLAKKHGADFTCPLTCGIFVNIVANASREREQSGEGDPVPYWRTLKKDGELCEKYPDGIDGHKLMLEMEGFEILKKGKRYFVKDYEKHLLDVASVKI